MPARDFKPKLGKSRPDRAIKSGRLTRIVVKAATRQRAAKSPWANALTRRPVAELGRGKGALYGLAPPQPGWRRVVVKVRIARHGTSDLGAARAHQGYLVRDGVTRDGEAGELYDREHDTVDGGAFLAGQKRDTYQFRLIVAPEDGDRLADLKPFVRDLMAGIEHDLDTKLDWVAVDHFNTGHPHTHIIIAGHDDRGQDLVMARHYISHGIRHRARDLVTLELGPELDWERTLKLSNEVKAERLTSLDRSILKDARENVLAVAAMPDHARDRQSLHVGRLRQLERMGLAHEKQTGVWALDANLETKLRGMGERGDIMVTMQRVMRAHGIERPAGEFAMFSGAARSAPVIGRIVEVGIADEMNERRYLMVDGIDGRLHYAETSKLHTHDMPTAGMIVALSGGGAKPQAGNPQVEILSLWPLDRLRSAEAATWLDKVIVAQVRPVIHQHCFGAEVAAALVAREDWLLAHGLAKSVSSDTITPNPNMLRDLDRRGFERAVAKVSAELNLPHEVPIAGLAVIGRHVRTVDLPTMRLAVIKGREAFTLVPWRPELQQMRGKDIAVGVHGRAITLLIAKGRDLGLSR